MCYDRVNCELWGRGMNLMVRPKSADTEVDMMTRAIYANEELFKIYAQRLFKKSDFDLICETTRQEDLDDRGIGSVKTNPYYQYWHKRSGHTFWIKFEFRSDYNDKFEWHFSNKLEYCKHFQEDVWPEKVYIVIGLGGRPLKPSYMLCLPLDEFNNRGYHNNILEKYGRGPTKPFDYQRGCPI
jgi:hypothetical protein